MNPEKTKYLHMEVPFLIKKKKVFSH